MKNIFPVFLLLIITLSSCQQKHKLIVNNGFIHGTTYHILYYSNKDLKSEIEAEMHKVDASLSAFLPTSIISRINTNDTSVTTDSLFNITYYLAQIISEKTNGAFDITVAPLVNIWGFGFENKDSINKNKIDSILNFTGYNNISLVKNKFIKSDPRVMLDASAIAKGLSVDVVSNFLEHKRIKNYLVEIGGEIRSKGYKNENIKWKVGIDKPIDNIMPEERELQEILELNDAAMATSGNYRQFYIKNGIKYSHTINPKTGYPVNHRLLSVSVIAPSCMIADAYATAFMVLGLNESKIIINSNPELEAYLIYSDSLGNFKTYITPGMEKLILK